MEKFEEVEVVVEEEGGGKEYRREQEYTRFLDSGFRRRFTFSFTHVLLFTGWCIFCIWFTWCKQCLKLKRKCHSRFGRCSSSRSCEHFNDYDDDDDDTGNDDDDNDDKCFRHLATDLRVTPMA